MTAQERLNKVLELVEQGATIYFRTALTNIPVTKKTFDNFHKSGYDLFKVKNGSLFIRRGKNWDCVDGCKIEAYK